MGIEGSGDFDQDGIINSLDLDSDADGCPDVQEAGLPDPDDNGILGTGTLRPVSHGAGSLTAGAPQGGGLSRWCRLT